MLESDSESDESDVENPSAHISIDDAESTSSTSPSVTEDKNSQGKESRPKKRRKVLDKAMGGAVPKFLYDRAWNDTEPDLSCVLRFIQCGVGIFKTLCSLLFAVLTCRWVLILNKKV